jgi:hypothetical protein
MSKQLHIEHQNPKDGETKDTLPLDSQENKEGVLTSTCTYPNFEATCSASYFHARRNEIITREV